VGILPSIFYVGCFQTLFSRPTSGHNREAGMAPRILSREATERVFQLAQNKTPPPLKIVEHRARIELANAELEAQVKESGGTTHKSIQNIVRMRISLDTLYADWAEGVERIRWLDIPAKADITVEQILRECVYDTESIVGEMGVVALAWFLNINGYAGLLKGLAERWLVEVHPFLQESLVLDDEMQRVFQDAKSFFGVTDDKEADKRLEEYIKPRVNRSWSPHAVRALTAHCAFSLGSYAEAINEADFAHNEKDVQDFDKKLYRKGDPEIEAAMLSIERRKADILIELLAKRRSN
jgi:hypothetical protein